MIVNYEKGVKEKANPRVTLCAVCSLEPALLRPCDRCRAVVCDPNLTDCYQVHRRDRHDA